MKKVFISYSRQDAKIVQQLREKLSETGVAVWVDTEDIRGGDIWRKQTVDALESSEIFLLILSSKSIRSKHVRAELDLAQNASIKVIPVEIESALQIPSEMKYQLAGIQRLRLYENIDREFEQLLKTIGPGKPDRQQTKTVKSTAPKSIRSKVLVRMSLLAGILIIISLLWMLLPGIRHALLSGSSAKQPRLAVLPFRLIGEEPVTEAFSQGLLYTVTSILAKEQFHSTVRVIPASEVLDEGIASAGKAAEIFQADLAISGNIERSGKLARLNLDLVDAASRTGLNSQTITMHHSNILAFQNEVVDKLAKLLNVKLSPEALETLKASGTMVPGAYEFYLQGRGYLLRFTNQDNVDAAISLFERAISEDSSYALAYAGLGEAYLRKYQRTRDKIWIEKAFQYGEQAITLDNRLSPAYFTRGLYYRIRGRYEEAVVEYHMALELEPNNAAAYRGLAYAYENLNKLDLAEESYQKAIRVKPGYWAGYNDLGLFYEIETRYDEAIEQFRHVIELVPDSPIGYYNIGLQYHNMGQPEEAIPWYKKVIELNPDDIETLSGAYFSLGGIYYSQENFSEAIRMYRKIVNLQKNDMWGWQMLANAYYFAGDQNAARDAWRQAIVFAEERLEVNPDHTDALALLACAQAMLGNREQSLAAISRLLAQERLDPDLLQQIGIAYAVLGERDLACRYIDKALKNGLAPESLEGIKWLEELRADPYYKRLMERYLNKT